MCVCLFFCPLLLFVLCGCAQLGSARSGCVPRQHAIDMYSRGGVARHRGICGRFWHSLWQNNYLSACWHDTLPVKRRLARRDMLRLC